MSRIFLLASLDGVLLVEILPICIANILDIPYALLSASRLILRCWRKLMNKLNRLKSKKLIDKTYLLWRILKLNNTLKMHY
jgi:hypothetical protein